MKKLKQLTTSYKQFIFMYLGVAADFRHKEAVGGYVPVRFEWVAHAVGIHAVGGAARAVNPKAKIVRRNGAVAVDAEHLARARHEILRQRAVLLVT